VDLTGPDRHLVRAPEGGTLAPMNEEQRQDLRAMMARFATGVTVVAARHGPLLAGMTANAIASVSVDPPLLLASINVKSETHQAIIGSHSFAVSVLGPQQQALADCFARPTTAGKLQGFCDAPWHEAETGSPILDGCIAFFDCRVTARHPGGDHSLFVGEIAAAGFTPDADPLIWYASGYRRLTPG
jgi:flavin reductase (DIM6/NTAB) family NADH-FMN oxidoreductase RutF